MEKEKVKIDIDRLKKIYNVKNYEELAKELNISKSAIDGWIRNKKVPSKYIIEIEQNNEFKEISEREALIDGIYKNIKLLNNIDLYQTLIFTSEKIREAYKEKLRQEKELENFSKENHI
ncbi:MAG: helix-turn-helix domain-containing protein [Arcobacter sp.]|jgi:hypothetical protein|uniref:helix-turn-helix domain-containing protein n=1 Tax=Arcobacter sp. TaxID=1872629 RepID=UPI002587DA7D|nr:helix-turn-helix domain-containing protein [Arcobacter sp.]MDD3008579.1 helix-turn-helix domain-containing protein [Arcobacter sp.]